jgi:hypothetical protein
MMLYFFKTFEGLGHGSGNKVLPHEPEACGPVSFREFLYFLQNRFDLPHCCSALSTYLPLGRLSIQLGHPVLPTCVKPVRLAA